MERFSSHSIQISRLALKLSNSGSLAVWERTVQVQPQGASKALPTRSRRESDPYASGAFWRHTQDQRSLFAQVFHTSPLRYLSYIAHYSIGSDGTQQISVYLVCQRLYFEIHHSVASLQLYPRFIFDQSCTSIFVPTRIRAPSLFIVSCRSFSITIIEL